ncbi:type I glyceraldehyde-3-phosphate dehydrogenase [Actibacterium sp. MT2.3-13A]|uniref:type I glyceraldehyde-3-phosphate dehydrogenase n=1 Tax=Actibacterium sp. MT2.3-13A TaxID=2828332 RepID=UPI001BAB2C55|nr:type I glyceraldehyde-3-phosphate dehydrogenase [Actibacterium sp. MT2.3-13A]
MSVKLAINGFGRIGRNVLRALVEQDRRDLEVVAINDLGPVESLAHLLRHDSVHGRFPGTVTTGADSLDVGRGRIAVTAQRDPSRLPWGDVDIVLECTGLFTSREKAAVHLANGARRVLVSAPAEGADRTVVYGVNHDRLTAADLVVSNASCTTNCLVPVVKVLNDAIGIARAFMTTVHSYTGDQPTLDALHSDLYRGRAAALSMVPTSTGATRALTVVLPEMKGRIDGVAVRVPTPNVSLVDLTFDAPRPTTAEEINDAIRAAAAGPLKGILGVTEEKLVSVDLTHEPHSSVFATDQTRVTDGTLCRILTWYDNEWAFSCRMLDTAAAMARFL